MYPVLFYLPGGLPVFGYGLVLGCALALAAHIGAYLAERSGIPRSKIWIFAAIVIAVGFLGGRIHELIIQGSLNPAELLQLQHSGRTAYGGFLFATASAVIAAYALKIPFWKITDAAAPGMAIGLGVARIGCFLFGCDYGFISERWGLEFPYGSPAWYDQVQAGLIPAEASTSLPVFPAQLLASLVGFVLFGVLLRVWYQRPRRAGTVLLLFFLLYGLARAGLEQLRMDAGRGEILGLTTSTTIGLVTAAIAAVFLLVPQLAKLRGDAGEIVEPPPEDKTKAKAKD